MTSQARTETEYGDLTIHGSTATLMMDARASSMWEQAGTPAGDAWRREMWPAVETLAREAGAVCLTIEHLDYTADQRDLEPDGDDLEPDGDA